jgi:hypothetical protein
MLIAESFNQLGKTSQLFILLNWTGAFAAMVMNFSVSRKATGRWKFLLQTATFMALIYAACYGILIMGHYEAYQWARTLEKFSIIVWPMLWIIHGLIGVSVHRRIQRNTLRVLELVEKQLKEKGMAHKPILPLRWNNT